MICRKCKHELHEENITTEIAAHDEHMLDILITCPECQHVINDFVPESDFVDLED